VKIGSSNLFSLLVTALVGAIFLLLAFETWALFTDNKTITDYFREAVQAFPGWAFVAAILVGIVLGHFLWGPATGILAPAPRKIRELMRQRAAP
jgi:predicted ribosomally synthesized peptide with SipW-like signal peptide